MNKVWLGTLCFLAGIFMVPLVAYGYLRLGAPPVAVKDPAFPKEKQLVHLVLNARIDREKPGSVPMVATPDNLVAGAVIYKQQCAFCHGVPAHPSPMAKNEYPSAPQLWQAHGHSGVVGVSDDPPGETYWKVKNGIRLTGMPAYADLLSENQMWQVTLLVASADKPLPAAAQVNLAK